VRKHDKAIRNLSMYRRLSAPFRTLPDLFILGAQKSGTSSLFQYLIETPWIFPSLFKEVQFFNHHFDKGLIWYKGSFPSYFYKFWKKIRTGHFLTLDASADYLFHPRPAKLISQFLPNAKFIVLFRNPVDRAYSNYFMIRDQFERGPVSFEEAIKEEKNRTEGQREKLIENKNYYNWNFDAHSYLARGIYINQLKSWMAIFPREKFLIITTEEFQTQPKKILNNVLQFLDLPNWELNEYPMHNIRKYPPMRDETRKILTEYFKPYNEELYNFLGVDFNWK